MYSSTFYSKYTVEYWHKYNLRPSGLYNFQYYHTDSFLKAAFKFLYYKLNKNYFVMFRNEEKIIKNLNTNEKDTKYGKRQFRK